MKQSPQSTPDHIVQFYESDSFLLPTIQKFLRDGDTAIVVATKIHRDGLEEALIESGIDLDELRSIGAYISFDAEEMMAKFIVNGMPDRNSFFEIFGSLIGKIGKGRENVRVFGEMVSILCEQGNCQGAVELEHLWNQLSRIEPFTLICAYPMHLFETSGKSHAFTEICEAHTHVHPSETYSNLDNEKARLKEIAALQQRAVCLEAEIKERKKLEKQKDEFIAVASHELKTPVTSVKAYTQILKTIFEQKNDKDAAILLSKMNGQINKLTHLITDLLDVTKIESGKITFNERKFDINILIREVVDEMQKMTSKHTIVAYTRGKASVYGDRERIGQVITNLLSNAIKYSQHATSIVVESSATDNKITVRVTDFGIGIQETAQNKLFNRFYRVEGNGENTYPGLGLGLYISREIISRHNGKIWMESVKGEGSTFYFSLPIVEKVQKKEDLPSIEFSSATMLQ